MQSIARRVGVGAVAIFFASLVAVPPATAQTAPVGPKAPAAAADAYALDVDARLTSLNIGVDRGPFAHSSQECPPQVDKADEAEEIGAGPIPADGALVNNIGLLTSFAGANCTGKNGLPLASASAQAVDVRLINQAGVPLIQADVLRADSTTDCFDAPGGKSIITNLRVGTTNVSVPPNEKNFKVAPQVFNPLGLQVIANEQFPTADGRGYVVNALHIYQFSPATVPQPISPLFTGDLIIAHAMSTVNCPNGAPTTGGSNPIFIEKNSDKAAARPGDTVTYTATVQNKAAQACPVNQLIDHLPSAFEFVSTSGGFGTTATTVNRPGGGQDIIIKPTNVTIPVGGSLSQTFVVTVKTDAQPGTYFNNVEILCGNLGNFVKGLDAPVTVTTDEEDEEEPPPPPPAKAECEDGIDNDGDGKIDFPNDPGCSSKKDDSEEDEHPRTGGESLAGLGILLLLGAYGVRRKLVVS